MDSTASASALPTPVAACRWRMARALLAQRGQLILWVPVCLGLGIGAWFALPWEPGAPFYWSGGALAVALVLAGRLAGEAAAPLPWALALILVGALLAGARAHSVAEPVLGFRYYGPVQGRVVGIDRSASDKVRLTLDRVVLDDVAPARTPARVRVSLHGQQGFITPEPGLTVILTGHLSPPSGPVEPGGFDFRRTAWFQRLGAVGYTRTPVLALAPAEEGRAGLTVFRVRMTLSAWIQARIPGTAGGFAAAILTGDRSGVPLAVIEDLRNSNMAHLLAISGLHMGLLTGVVFTALRAGMALVPWLALRYPIRKFAALGALAVGAGYLALSGGAVSTMRAFIMVSVMLVAVLLERRAISLRSVAIAATIVLVLTPEALLGAGFQMSFAATTALVAAFGLLRDYRDRLPRLPRWLSPALAVVLSSAVAGAATAPYSAAQFNRLADYGQIANLLSVPLMGAVVMPAAVAAAVCWPFGLAALPLWVMGRGLQWILLVAHSVSSLDGAVTHVIAPGPWVLPLISLGFLWLLAWRGAARWLGVPVMLLAFLLWTQAVRPTVLIADTSGLVGILGPEGRVLSRSRGDGFAASTWLENDGDGVDQETAAARPGFSGARGDKAARVDGLRLRHVTSKAAAATLNGGCNAEIVVTNKEVASASPKDCLLFDLLSLRETGSVAIWAETGLLRIVTAAERSGTRLWTR